MPGPVLATGLIRSRIYAEALAAASLRIEAMCELRPSGNDPRHRRWNRVPTFLLVTAVKA